jgi:peroxiredoxin Q/BCP
MHFGHDNSSIHLEKIMEIKVGEKAPDFKLLDENEVEHSLAQYLGKSVVLFFYPEDDTPGCVKEVCNFRDDYSKYEREGAVLLGVSIHFTRRSWT